MSKNAILVKEQEVKELATKIKENKSVIAFKYQGLNVETFMNIRKSMLSNACEIKIYKNNISRRAFQSLNYDDMIDSLKGPIAILFSKDDILLPAKEIFKYAKETKVIEIVKGIIDGQIYEYSKLEELSKTPSYETLLTQLAAGMLSPVKDIAVGLNMLVEKMEEQSQA